MLAGLLGVVAHDVDELLLRIEEDRQGLPLMAELEVSARGTDDVNVLNALHGQQLAERAEMAVGDVQALAQLPVLKLGQPG